MEFSSRNGQQPSPVSSPAASNQSNQAGKKGKRKVLRLATTLVIIGLVVLLVGLGYKMFGAGSESSLLNKDKYQAVFLNGGQVYFGKVSKMNSSFVVVEDIYYLRVNEQQGEGTDATQATNQDISLAKLGCELHGPEDEMVINRDQVTFWENLKDDGQVAKAIAEYARQNPDGQKCEQPAAS